MISVNEALSILEQNTFKSQGFKNTLVINALGFVLAEDVISPINMPPFKQSAVDGYALYLHHDLNYNLKGEIKAGDDYHPTLNVGEAVRIFTGAPVPETANAIVMQEKSNCNRRNTSFRRTSKSKSKYSPSWRANKKRRCCFKIWHTIKRSRYCFFDISRSYRN